MPFCRQCFTVYKTKALTLLCAFRFPPKKGKMGQRQLTSQIAGLLKLKKKYASGGCREGRRGCPSVKQQRIPHFFSSLQSEDADQDEVIMH